MKRRGFLKLFAVGVGGALLPLPELATVDGLRLAVDLRNRMLETVRQVLRPAFFVLIGDASGERVWHVFELPSELPAATGGTLNIPLNLKLRAERSCTIQGFEILDGDGNWLVRGDGLDLFGLGADAFMRAGDQLAIQSVGLSAE